MAKLLAKISACTLCQAHLPLAPKPILQASTQARILIAGQAPGVKTHHKGIPFDDASGERLRTWLNVTREQFYDPNLFAIIPMGFCFPGSIEKNGKKQGDKPPRPECAATWHQALLALMPQIELIVILGQYAIDYHLPRESSEAVNLTSPITKHQTTGANVTVIPKLKPITVTQACAQWQQYWPKYLVLPHPSPRNNLWLKQHPEFERDMLPRLRMRIASLLNLQPH
ncbi:uracil-DNA glycosylase family protein [Shewanella oncorhynchi]|uniref:uracil-DNA glycosylase family protein n=1 Tax=Shewanella TaxID=22 RepID=UPI001B51B562|nr:uracil-DNA glycosylase family protein [Shewanella sp. SM74]MBP8118016.1 uracil-DNA glycosylase family protein [Shewanella sp.]MCU8011890.1 uracil-DNA glycosylase family protein [Shewanella sp. SM74]